MDCSGRAPLKCPGYIERPCRKPPFLRSLIPAFWVLVCYATTQLATSLHQRHIQVALMHGSGITNYINHLSLKFRGTKFMRGTPKQTRLCYRAVCAKIQKIKCMLLCDQIHFFFNVLPQIYPSNYIRDGHRWCVVIRKPGNARRTLGPSSNVFSFFLSFFLGCFVGIKIQKCRVLVKCPAMRCRSRSL